MTKSEMIQDVIETWERYVDIDHPEYLTADKRGIEDLLNEIANMIDYFSTEDK